MALPYGVLAAAFPAFLQVLSAFLQALLFVFALALALAFGCGLLFFAPLPGLGFPAFALLES